ncbi:ExbD/TolR family protein [Microbulbifer thermotolerans]|nr:biopolymer transporter ExbD [Microbulbifer thermotolerans]MCX2793498.1 biopolymer transporter ExbD [Microbulbifer thermotolerans]MCX2830464.1 biopolymer transporter ExbD [Microbulbifer thermotolerans]MCX2835754.1 biopolymer transporter ExbD [Microbulbifer thermotolerans]WKT61360.1 biopolymer transporter ExbD [Microbulbifer thermotolerans]SFC88538.1 Biopolymer transport protein ExbD [Microbulbifer thermotolerans]
MRHESRRMKRMARSHRRKKTSGMNLTSLMDVFTILVFFLLTNTSSNEALEPPKVITLPDSVVETKPRETVTLMVTDEEILVESNSVIATEEVINSEETVIEAIKQAMIAELNKALLVAQAGDEEAAGDEAVKQRPPEVNILADRTIPFSLLKKVMSSCTEAGYTKVSLAVIQKASQG